MTTTMTNTEQKHLFYILYILYDVVVSSFTYHCYIYLSILCINFYSQTQVLLVSEDQFSTLCTMAIRNAHMRRNENDLNWMIELVSITSNRIGYRVYAQTKILFEADTYRLLDLALLHTSEENKRRTKMIITLDHEGLCRIYGLPTTVVV